jgi:hypothetical protein
MAKALLIVDGRQPAASLGLLLAEVPVTIAPSKPEGAR